MTSTSTSAGGQATLFASVPFAVADEPRDVHQRRLNRERQLRWRRRHQFLAPASESPVPYEGGSDDGNNG